MKFKSNVWKIVLCLVVIAVLAVGIYFSLPKILVLLGLLVSLFLPFLLGALFSVVVNPLASFLQRKLKIPRGLSAVLVLVLTIGILGSFLTFAVWKIVDEVRHLYTQFPAIYESVQLSVENFMTKWATLYGSLPENIQTAITATGTGISDKIAAFINTKSSPMMGYASNIAKALPGIFIGMIVFILSSYFMVADPGTISKAVNRIFTQKFLERMRGVKTQIKKYLGGYVKAQAIIMCIAFFVILIGLSFLGVNYALLIAIGIAFLDALPFFGSGAVLWPWAALSLINGDFKLGIGLVVIYIAVALMRHLIEPKIVSTSIGMNPLLTLMSMYIGYRLLSIGGMILGPVILMLIISFYKAGIFDGLIRVLKLVFQFIKNQLLLLGGSIKNYFRSETK